MIPSHQNLNTTIPVRESKYVMYHGEWILKCEKERLIRDKERNNAYPLLGLDIYYENASYDEVKRMIEKKADIRAYNNSALIMAIKKGNLNIVKLLVESGAKILYPNYLPIDIAFICGETNIVRYFLERPIKYEIPMIFGKLSLAKRDVKHIVYDHFRNDVWYDNSLARDKIAVLLMAYCISSKRRSWQSSVYRTFARSPLHERQLLGTIMSFI
jgi:ankyrin repeat protein